MTSMRTPFLALLIAASAQPLLATPSSPLTYSNTLYVAGTGTYDVLTLGQFNTALGTLTGVTVKVNALTIQGSFWAKGPGVSLVAFTDTIRLREDSGVSGTSLNTLGFNQITVLTDADSNLTVSPDIFNAVLSNSSESTFNITQFTARSNQSYTIDASKWGAYTGTGTIGFQLRNLPSVTIAGGIGSFNTTLATGFADMSVVYTYTPVSVPEPSTYGLMLGGLALAAVAVRRRRKA